MFKSPNCLTVVPVGFIDNLAFTICVNSGDIKSHPAFHNEGVGDRAASILNSLYCGKDIAKVIEETSITGVVFFDKEGLEGIPFIRYEGKVSDVYKLRGLGEVPYKIAPGYTDENFDEDYVLFASPFSALHWDSRIEHIPGYNYPIEAVILTVDRLHGSRRYVVGYATDHLNSSKRVNITIDDKYLAKTDRNDVSNSVKEILAEITDEPELMECSVRILNFLK